MANELFARLEQTHRLPPGLLDAVWAAESGRGKNMLSPVGAQGHFQFMPATAKEYGLRDPMDLTESAQAAARKFADLHKAYGGDLPKVLAAYNWGNGNLNRNGLERAPAETRNYIEKVSAFMGKPASAKAVAKPAAQPAGRDLSAELFGDESAAAPAQTAGRNLTAELFGDEKAPPSRAQMFKDELLTSIPGGVVRGIKDVIDTGAEIVSRLGGKEEAARVKAMNDAGKAEFSAAQERTGAGASGVARVGGNIVATLPVGGVLAVPAKAVGATRLANALRSGGFVTGAPAATTFGGRAADLGIRMAGGGATGYASAGLIDQDSANTGGVIGTLLPPAAKVAGAVGGAVSALVRPFTSGGQERIAGAALRQFAANPDDAIRNIRNTPEMIPGSAPTTVAASGDEGLAGLSRTLQSADQNYANELASRSFAQNAARTDALQEVAGNTGKLSIASQARDEATEAMREAVLDAAGRLQARPVLDAIDRLIAKPDNAGKLAQSALSDFRNRIAQWSPDGQIDARALYAIRKDINDILGGKLQGEAGNLRYASGQLVKVKGLIDDAIDKASRRVEMSSGRSVMPYGANIERAGAAGPYGSMNPRPTWRGYLDKYAEMSIPINQMEKLDEVMKAASTGSVDKNGNAILSAAKLNNYLRNNAKDLQKTLSKDQLDLLRRMSADLNAAQLAATAGKAVGSNTVQNISGVNALTSLVGETVGRSAPMQATAGRAINWLYKKPDQEIVNKLGQALLDPQEAARLMSTPEGNALFRALTDQAGRIGYRSAPALSAQ